MTKSEFNTARALRAAVRRQAHAARASQPEKQTVSEEILRRALALPACRDAKSLLFYIDVRDEVRTRAAVRAEMQRRGRVAIPYCVQEHLELFWLSDWQQLCPGRFGVLEPRRELRTLPEHRVMLQEIEAVLVPGVAFDRRGGRLGHGKGYYDRLLARVHTSTQLIGLAFDCQIVDRLDLQNHDVPMDFVVTQSRFFNRNAAGPPTFDPRGESAT